MTLVIYHPSCDDLADYLIVVTQTYWPSYKALVN